MIEVAGCYAPGGGQGFAFATTCYPSAREIPLVDRAGGVRGGVVPQRRFGFTAGLAHRPKNFTEQWSRGRRRFLSIASSRRLTRTGPRESGPVFHLLSKPCDGRRVSCCHRSAISNGSVETQASGMISSRTARRGGRTGGWRANGVVEANRRSPPESEATGGPVGLTGRGFSSLRLPRRALRPVDAIKTRVPGSGQPAEQGFAHRQNRNRGREISIVLAMEL